MALPRDEGIAVETMLFRQLESDFEYRTRHHLTLLVLEAQLENFVVDKALKSLFTAP